MKGRVTASGRDLRTMARIVSDDRGEPPAEGLAPSLLSDLLRLIGCDFVIFGGTDSSQQADWFGQTVPPKPTTPRSTSRRSGPITGTVPAATRNAPATCTASSKISDFYSARQWHSTGMYQDCCRRTGSSMS